VGIHQEDALDWKTLGPLGDSATQFPIGTEATATITATEINALTSQGNELRIQKLGTYDCAGADWQGETHNLQLRSEGAKAIAYVQVNEDWKSLGELDKASIQKIITAEVRLNTAIIDSGKRIQDVELTAQPTKTATVVLESGSIQFPEQWNRGQSQELPKLTNLQPEKLSITEQRQALATAVAASNLLERIGTERDGGRVYDAGTYWFLYQQGNAIGILDKISDRVILRLEPGQEPIFKPMPEDQGRLKFLYENFGQAQQQQQQQTVQTHRGVSMRH
jgi:hypothetical protein